jgi:hypothetical protein
MVRGAHGGGESDRAGGGATLEEHRGAHAGGVVTDEVLPGRYAGTLSTDPKLGGIHSLDLQRGRSRNV